jgi:hypothetical protein
LQHRSTSQGTTADQVAHARDAAPPVGRPLGFLALIVPVAFAFKRHPPILHDHPDGIGGIRQITSQPLYDAVGDQRIRPPMQKGQADLDVIRPPPTSRFATFSAARLRRYLRTKPVNMATPSFTATSAA